MHDAIAAASAWMTNNEQLELRTAVARQLNGK